MIIRTPRHKHRLSRRRFLALLGACLAAPALRPLAHSLPLDVPPTLMLHTKDRWKLEKILKWLKANGYESVGYRALAQALRGEVMLPPRPVIITIDDIGSGYIQPYFYAMADLVEAAGYRGVFGVVTRESPVRNPRGWEFLRELAARGWELDTHTSRHVILPALRSLEELRAEIVDSARMIADGTGQAPTSLIAPYGNVYLRGRTFDQRIFDMAAEADLTFVVGLAEGRQICGNAQAPYYVGRVGVGVDHIQTGWWLTHFHTPTCPQPTAPPG